MFIKKLLFILLIPILFQLSFSEFIFLDLVDGGCFGDDSTTVQAFYDNGSIINSDNYEVTIYAGPLRSFGELTTFNPSDESVRVDFGDEFFTFRYEFRTPNDSNYLGLEGSIELFDCGLTRNPQGGIVILSIETQDNVEIEIMYDESEILLEFDDESEFLEDVINQFDREFSQRFIIFNVLGDDIGQVELTSNSDFVLDINSDLQEFEEGSYNITVNSEFFAINIVANSTIPEVEIEDATAEQEEIIQTTNEDNDLEEVIDINQENGFVSQETQSRFSLSDILLYIGIFIIIMLFLAGVIYVLFSAQGAHKNTKFGYDEMLRNQELPQTSLEKKIMEYCDTHKENLSPEEVVNELVKEGYDKRRVIETLIVYIDKQNKK